MKYEDYTNSKISHTRLIQVIGVLERCAITYDSINKDASEINKTIEALRKVLDTDMVSK